MTFPLPITAPYPAYPWIVSEATGGSFSAQNFCDVPLPSGIVPGDRLLTVLAVVRGGSTIVIPDSGWTTLVSGAGPSNLRVVAVLERVADGTEGASVAHIFSASSRWASVTVCIRDAAVREASGAFTTSTSATPDPPNHTWASGVRDTLVIAAGCVDFGNTINDWTGNPTNYDVVATSRPSSSGYAYASVRVVNRYLPAVTSENPGAFSLTASRSWGAITVFLARQP